MTRAIPTWMGKEGVFWILPRGGIQASPYAGLYTNTCERGFRILKEIQNILERKQYTRWNMGVQTSSFQNAISHDPSAIFTPILHLKLIAYLASLSFFLHPSIHSSPDISSVLESE